jgi:phosphatidylserine/phosphatidylglycerophosphate/cardiolipin synthase-like enzyme
METNLSKINQFSSGAFIINSVRENFSPFESNDELFLTQANSTILKSEIIKLIENSKSVIKVCSFIITDKEIFEVLMRRAKESQVAIFILTQLDPSKLSNNVFLTEEENKEQTQNIHLTYIKHLYDNGVHVRASTSAHAKFIISDRKIGFLMSANITTPSLTLNTESGIYIDTESVIQLDCLFDLIFLKGTTYRQYIAASVKGKQLVVQNESGVKPNWLPTTENFSVKYTYENITSNLLDSIINVVESAKEFLYISSYSIVGLNNIPKLTNALKEASARGVDINVFCRGMNYRLDHLKGCNEFHSIGIKIYGDIYNHSKGILNEHEGLLFTANIDGNHGLINGFEVGSFLTKNQHEVFLNFHKHLISTSPFIFKSSPTRNDLFEMYQTLEKAKGITPPIFDEDLTINIKPGVIVKKEELEAQPIFYVRLKEGAFEEFLLVGVSCYKVYYKNGCFLISENARMNYHSDKYILRYNNLKIIYN